MIRLDRFLVLQALHRLGVTLAYPKGGRIPARRLLLFWFHEYPGSGLPRVEVIFIMNNMGPTQLGLVV